MAEHEIYRVTSFEIVAPNSLEVVFDDNSERIIDFGPALGGDLYRPLRDPDFFNRVEIDREVGTLVWPNGADFDPETLHNWPRYEEALAERARRWELTTA